LRQGLSRLFDFVHEPAQGDIALGLFGPRRLDRGLDRRAGQLEDRQTLWRGLAFREAARERSHHVATAASRGSQTATLPIDPPGGPSRSSNSRSIQIRRQFTRRRRGA
jgi:hypothetical protein